MTASSRHSVGRKGRPVGLTALVGILVPLLALTAVACGPGGTEPQNATQAMTDILGRAPKGQAAKIAKAGEMIAANTEDYPPLSYRDDDGRLVGFDVEVAKAVAERLGLKVRYTQPAWEAVPAGLSSGKFDVSIGSLSPEQGLEGDVAYSKPYYYTTGQLLVRVGAAKLKGVDALAGKSVGAGIHTVFYRWLQGNSTANITAFTGDAEALAALEAGKVEAVLTSGLAAAQAVKDGKGVELSGAPLFAEPMAFVVRGDEKDWLAVLNGAIVELHKDKTLSELSTDWLGMDFTRPTPSASTSAAE